MSKIVIIYQSYIIIEEDDFYTLKLKEINYK